MLKGKGQISPVHLTEKGLQLGREILNQVKRVKPLGAKVLRDGFSGTSVP